MRNRFQRVTMDKNQIRKRVRMDKKQVLKE